MIVLVTYLLFFINLYLYSAGAATNVANISANIKKDWATQRTPRAQNSAVVSFSTPGNVSMIGAFSMPVQQHDATATTSNNLDSTPTQQIR